MKLILAALSLLRQDWDDSEAGATIRHVMHDDVFVPSLALSYLSYVI